LYERPRSESSVVQPWPCAATYWRSSSQIGQFAGGLSDGSYCVPQVVQMKAGMGRLGIEDPVGRARIVGKNIVGQKSLVVHRLT
jgi:hypothetical protein